MHPAEPTSPARLALVVMGVSGSGKSTVGAGLAQALGLEFIDGDALHAPESVAKMREGIALVDADRWALARPHRRPAGQRARPPRRRGRRLLGLAPRLPRSPARRRSRRALRVPRWRRRAPRLTPRGRSGHYMPPALLASQLATLERPATDEAGVARFDIAMPAEEIVRRAAAALGGRAA